VIRTLQRTISILAVLSAVFLGNRAEAEGNLAVNPVIVPLELKVDKTFSPKELTFETGKYYRLDLTNKILGVSDVQVMAPDFFRNVWIDQAKVGSLAIRTAAVYSLAFDGPEGRIELTFVPIRPGSYKVWVPGLDSASATFVVR
jgi:uncharacterized cupredoxin-like copper-binding protein